MSQARIFPFRRVSVDHMVRGVTRVWWQLEPAFSDPGPHYFQLQVGSTGLQNSTDWQNVGGPMVDTYVAYDDEYRNTGAILVTHYRLLLTTAAGAYVSQTVSVYGELEEHDWVLSREIVRKERLRHSKTSVPGYLLKAMRYGNKCTRCLDPLTQEPADVDCQFCHGTGFEVGFFQPLPMQCWDISPQVIAEKQDVRGGGGTTRQQASITARVLGFPQIDAGDVWINGKSDERWMVETIKVAAALRGVPIIYEIGLNMIPTSSTMYLIEVGGEPPEREGPVLPDTGCGAVTVDHDYGGPDALSYQNAAGCAVVDADVYVFRLADYEAAPYGLPNKELAVATTTTRVNGRWAYAINLDPGEYMVMFEKFGDYGPDFAPLTVTAPAPPSESSVIPPSEPPPIQSPGYKKFNENDPFWNI